MGEEPLPGPECLAALTDDEMWKQALRDVPRKWFVPERAWVTPMGNAPSYWVDGSTHPDLWNRAVYSDSTIVTQIEDGSTELTPQAAESAIPSSSTTAPSLVAGFLELLDPYPGDRVLEIGTGTGWTAGLLSARLGGDNVTSIEVDEQVADHARANLEQAGFSPRLVVGDGQKGRPDGALFDRVHVTCGVAEIPYAWVEQVRPGGVIALPWAPNHAGGHTLALAATGTQAVGRIRDDTAFMMLRSQRHDYPPPTGKHRGSPARIDPRRVNAAGIGFEVALAGLLPGVVLNGLGLRAGADQVGIRHPATASYAFATVDGDVENVAQLGERDLWNELEAAYLTWVGWGQPGRERFGVTVDASGQHVWLDRPGNRIERMEC